MLGHHIAERVHDPKSEIVELKKAIAETDQDRVGRSRPLAGNETEG